MKIFSILLFFGLSLQGSAAYGLTDSDSLAKLARDLVPYLQKHVRSFSRPIQLFHGTKDKDHSDHDYINGQLAKAFDPDYSNFDTAGPGLHLARNPEVSKLYGPRIFVLESEADHFKFLDLTHSGFYLPSSARFLDPELLRRGKKLKCFFWENLWQFGHPQCSVLRQTLTQELGINGFGYKIRNFPTTHPEEKNNRATLAFVVSNLRGMQIKATLDGRILELSMRRFASAQHFSSTEIWQSARLLGLNPKFPAEQRLSFGADRESIFALIDEFEQLQLTKPITEYLADQSSLTLFFERKRILESFLLSPETLRENWKYFLRRLPENFIFDEEMDAEGAKNFSLGKSGYIPSIGISKRYILPTVQTNNAPPTVFPAGSLSPRCQQAIRGQLPMLLNLPEAASALENLLNDGSSYSAVFLYRSSISKISDALQMYDRAFTNPFCAITEFFLHQFDTVMNTATFPAYANDLPVYLRPADPTARKNEFRRLMALIQSNPLENPDSSLLVFQTIVDILLLDPLATTEATLQFVNALYFEYQLATGNYNYLNLALEAPQRHFVPPSDFENGWDKIQGQQNSVERMRNLLWRIYAKDHALRPFQGDLPWIDRTR